MEALQKVADSLGMPVRSLIQYSLWSAVVLVMLGVGQTYITNIIGVAYPAFMSFRALETDGLDDDKQWLTYWVCFGAFNIVDQFAGIILRFIPFYFFVKCGFLIYLFHPSTLGATTVYNNLVLPQVKKYEDQIAKIEKKVSSLAGDKKED
uniref:Receptor expression-enhancing protein n=1 Tax=Strombidium inclinatum TaxID=197538 RepID=A0A7S3N0V6_9SPIT|mmetsp:Transcript_30829/g.47226  ORF Transcript_30829/g.47226 Transcript_30829/m.47226 type:complete len:150 (+) Transcript_30829:26-475(+)